MRTRGLPPSRGSCRHDVWAGTGEASWLSAMELSVDWERPSDLVGKIRQQHAMSDSCHADHVVHVEVGGPKVGGGIVGRAKDTKEYHLRLKAIWRVVLSREVSFSPFCNFK